MRSASRPWATALIAAGLCVAASGASRITLGAQTAAAQAPISFARDIRPILADNCLTCHGPDASRRETPFHFDTKEGAFLQPGIIVPGDSAKSELYYRVSTTDIGQQMPPPHSGHALTLKQIDLLKRWIDEGAKWDAHWAFDPPKRPEPPAVANAAWVRTPIDRFILARLEREGLKPSPEADRATLLRRLYYDLTGLPPAPKEVDAFVADRAPDAYERRVDALLASPRYGERMAMPWLDASRYADSHGYHIDSLRGMWPWRDWVINAFNRNQPYDQFVIEQLAGDLLPNATRDQKVASGFNRNHMINFEGGAIAEEYQVEYVVDRVEATSSAFLGLTMGCARCHSHRFDPISHREFYQFYAFFNNVPERGLDGRNGNADPLLPLPDAAQQQRLDELTAAIASHQRAVADAVAAPLQAEWEQQVLDSRPPVGLPGPTAHYEFDGGLADSSGRYQQGRTVTGDPTFGAGRIARAISFDGDTEVTLGTAGNVDGAHPFSVAMWLRGQGNVPIAILQKLDGPPEHRRGYEWSLDDLVLAGVQRWAGRLTISLSADGPGNAIQVRTRERVRLGDWSHVVLNYDGSRQAAGLRVYVDGKPAALEIVRDALTGSIATVAPLRIGHKPLGRPFIGQIDDLRLFDEVLTPDQITDLAVHAVPRAIVMGVGGKRTSAESAELRDYFLTQIAPEALRRQYAELKALRTQKQELEAAIPNAMVMAEMKQPRETFILARGDYRSPTERVQPGVPAVLPPLPAGISPDRLALAKWMVAPNHPLTSRVAVNRFWQTYFGIGIVKTQEDFGMQGEPPVHPELLDWLATEFMQTGWNVKAMQRLIVTSATYRQSSAVTPALLEKDPENRLLARGARIRLPAEIIRDTALAASGLLNGEIGGPSVFPYQPKGLWEELAFGEGFSVQSYEQSHGKDLYRRGMYTFWKRTVPPASLTTFDAPDREKCTARRGLTNTPLQALVLMNDPTFVEAARALAQRVLREVPAGDQGRVRLAFRLAAVRTPATAEVAVLQELLNKSRATYRRDRRAALQLVSVGESPRDSAIDVGELAAWTAVASAILNLDETITRQ